MTTARHQAITFDVGPTFVLPDLGALPDAAGTGTPAETQLDVACYDTPDLRLARARVTLQRSTGGDGAGWLVELPGGDGGRRELRRPAGRATKAPPKAVLEPLAGLVRQATVGQVARLQTRRTVVPLTDADGRVLAEVADDQVTATTFAPDPGSPTEISTWRQIGVALVDGDEELLDRLAAGLLAAGAVHRPPGGRSAGPPDPDGGADPTSVDGKAAKAGKKGKGGKGGKGGKAARKSARKAAARAVEQAAADGRTAGDVLALALRGQLDALQQADVMVRTDEPDGVHQVRVSCRRLRSTLTAYRAVLDRERTEPLRGELAWLAAQLSGARDREVALAHLQEVVAAQPEELVLGPVAARLQQAQLRDAATGRAEALRALGNARYLRLLDDLDDLVSAPPLTPRAARPARTVLGKALAAQASRAGRRLGAAEEALAGADPVPDLHEVRKAAKRLRYTAEVAGPVLGPDAAGLVEAMKAVQDVLGDRQDTVVTRELCRRFGIEAFAAGENAWTFGRLHAFEEARAAQAERAFRELAPVLRAQLEQAGG